MTKETVAKKTTEWDQNGRRLLPCGTNESSPVQPSALRDTRWSYNGRRKNTPAKEMEAPVDKILWGQDGRRILPTRSSANPAANKEVEDAPKKATVRLTNSEKTIRPHWMKLPSSTGTRVSLTERIRLAQKEEVVNNQVNEDSLAEGTLDPTLETSGDQPSTWTGEASEISSYQSDVSDASWVEKESEISSSISSRSGSSDIDLLDSTDSSSARTDSSSSSSSPEASTSQESFDEPMTTSTRPRNPTWDSPSTHSDSVDDTEEEAAGFEDTFDEDNQTSFYQPKVNETWMEEEYEVSSNSSSDIESFELSTSFSNEDSSYEASSSPSGSESFDRQESFETVIRPRAQWGQDGRRLYSNTETPFIPSIHSERRWSYDGKVKEPFADVTSKKEWDHNDCLDGQALEEEVSDQVDDDFRSSLHWPIGNETWMEDEECELASNCSSEVFDLESSFSGIDFSYEQSSSSSPESSISHESFEITTTEIRPEWNQESSRNGYRTTDEKESSKSLSSEDHHHDSTASNEDQETNRRRAPVARLTNSQRTIRPAWMKLPSATAKPMSITERIRLALAEAGEDAES